MQGKYYELKDLHKGMRVSVESLRKVTGVRILLDGSTFSQDEDVVGIGTIVGIGEDSKDVNIDNVFVVFNKYGRTVERPRSERKVVLK